MVETLNNNRFIEELEKMTSYKFTVLDIITYSLKGGFPVFHEEKFMTKEGFLDDRVFMFLDKNKNRKFTTKENPLNFLIQVIRKNENGKKYEFRIPNTNDLNTLKSNNYSYNSVNISIDEEEANKAYKDNSISKYKIHKFNLFDSARKGILIEDNNLSKSLKDYFGEDVYVVYSHKSEYLTEKNDLPQNSLNHIKKENAKVNFYDLAPILINQIEDLDELNEKLKGRKIDKIAFRPNLILKGVDTFKPQIIEKAKFIKINGLLMKKIKNCGRCKLITLNIEEICFDKNKEPLETLGDYKIDENSETLYGGYFCAENLVNENGDMKDLDSFKSDDNLVNIKKGDDVIIYL